MRALIRQGRDIRVDFFRGFALFCIFVGHIPDHGLWVVTLQVLGPSDATETFIFLADPPLAVLDALSLRFQPAAQHRPCRGRTPRAAAPGGRHRLIHKTGGTSAPEATCRPFQRYGDAVSPL